MFLLNILFALAWVTLTGQFTFINLAVGFVLSYLLLWLLPPGESRTVGYPWKIYRAVLFVLFFLKELIVANLRVAQLVLSPTSHLRPGIVAVPLSVQKDVQVTTLSTLITLTPGTLSLDVSEDRKTLYVHAIHIDDDDGESLRESIKEGFERRVLEVFS
jgi:multicomponent Na+:H+ antiporter subunit E